jgi:hypothetical protein
MFLTFSVNIPEIGCRSHNECSAKKACINGRCANPCESASPCLPNQECQVNDHQPVCIKGNVENSLGKVLCIEL